MPDGYYDVAEDNPEGWIALTPTYYAFESPPQSGASYSFTFINTPTQGCTPGFWNNEGQGWSKEFRQAQGHPGGAEGFFKHIEAWRTAGTFEGLEFR